MKEVLYFRAFLQMRGSYRSIFPFQWPKTNMHVPELVLLKSEILEMQFEYTSKSSICFS